MVMKTRHKVAYALTHDGSATVLVRTELRHPEQGRIVWTAPRPPSADELQQLRSVLLAATGERPVFSAPVSVSESVYRRLSTPFPSLRKAAKVFPSMLNMQLPFDLAQCQYTILNPREKEGQAHASALVVRNETMERILSECVALEMNPQVVQHEGLALWNEITVTERPAAGERRVIALMEQHRTVLLYGEGKVLIGAQQWADGLEQLEADAEGPAAWCARALLFLRSQWKNQQAPLTWCWCGGTAINGMTSVLEERLALPDSVGFRRRSASDCLMAQALNRMALVQPPDFHNFRSGAFEHPEAMQHQTKTRRNTLLWIYLLGVFLCAAGLGWKAMLNQQNAMLDRLLDEAVAKITAGLRAPKAQEVPFVSRILEDRRPALSAFTLTASRDAEQLLSRVLTAASENRIELQQVLLQMDSTELTGFGDRWDSGAFLEKELQQSGYQTDLQRRDAGADEMVHFVLKGVRREKN